VAPLLATAKKVLFLGDDNEIAPSPCMSAREEEAVLEQFQLQDDEVIEQLHYKGMLAGSGNAFRVALVHAGIEHQSVNAPIPLLGKLMVAGVSERQDKGLQNSIEVHQIINWLLTGPLAHDHANTIVVTSFNAQKKLLRHLLAEAGIGCNVFTFYELPETSVDNVIFSPVYTHLDRRPFLFDQGYSYFNSLFHRVNKILWIIGDLQIFDPKMHSPSGLLAKKLMP
jgi:hypothetical protein